MTNVQAAQHVLSNLEYNTLTVDEVKVLLHIVASYTNRKQHDVDSLVYAIRAINPHYGGGSSRANSEDYFLRLLMSDKKNFYRIAQFRPIQLFAMSEGLTISFPYAVTKYTN